MRLPFDNHTNVLLEAKRLSLGGVGLCLGGVCSTELLEFSRTELRKWSPEPEPPTPSDRDPSNSDERLPVGEGALCGVECPSCGSSFAIRFSHLSD